MPSAMTSGYDQSGPDSYLQMSIYGLTVMCEETHRQHLQTEINVYFV